MTNPNLQRVTRSLLRLGGPGRFAAHHREPALGLGIEVAEVGHVAFPLEPSRIEALIAQASASPFGYRDQTLHDESVRDSWEIPGSRVHFDAELWHGRLQRGLTEISESLGLADAKVTPIFDKLIIYPPGGFFARHRDSQKTARTAATLVVVLPSAHKGGEVVVSHGGRELAFSTAEAAGANYLSFLGFYADCVHETKPVRAGYRVALTYRLEVEAAEAPRSVADDIVDLERSLSAYFEDVDEDAPWLVYLFEHQYTEVSFGWEYLKNADRLRSDALVEAASRRDLGCFLALADVHEAYQLGEEGDEEEDEDDLGIAPPASERNVADDLPPVDGDPSDRAHILERLPRLEDEDEEEAEDDVPITSPESENLEHLMGPLTHRELALEQWMDRRGTLCEGIVEEVYDECIVSTADSYDRSAYDESYEPWTGNEGGEAEKWYRQAVLVIMPKSSERYDEAATPLASGPEEEDEPSPPAIVRRTRER